MRPPSRQAGTLGQVAKYARHGLAMASDTLAVRIRRFLADNPEAAPVEVQRAVGASRLRVALARMLDVDPIADPRHDAPDDPPGTSLPPRPVDAPPGERMQIVDDIGFQ